MKSDRKFRHLSLFSGCGGMDLGFRGDFKVNKNFIKTNQNKINSGTFIKLDRTNFECVFANDVKNSSKIFWEHNHLNENDIFMHASIVDLVKKHESGEEIFPKNIDIVTGGFPCQDFSISGLRKGFNSHKSHRNDYMIDNKQETRGLLYIWMKKVIEIVQPKIFVAENVKGLKNLKNIYETIKKDFSNINKGYKVFSKELFAPDFGIPQSRRRIFFIGVSQEFIDKYNINLSDKDLFPESEFIKEKDLFNQKDLYPEAKNCFINLKEPEDETSDLSQQKFSKAKYSKGQGQSVVNLNGLAPTIRSEHHGNIEFRYLSRKNGGNDLKDRRLTVRECARIQTFPDEMQFVFNSQNGSLSASSGYKLVGDAVPPLLSYKIAKKIEEFLFKYL